MYIYMYLESYYYLHSKVMGKISLPKDISKINTIRFFWLVKGRILLLPCVLNSIFPLTFFSKLTFIESQNSTFISKFHARLKFKLN